jgi:hypothetical protein
MTTEPAAPGRPAWRRRLERIALLVAVPALVAGLWYSVQRQPQVFDQLRWTWLLAVLLVGMPLITLSNALRFSLTLRLVGQRWPFPALLRASILSSAANMLPLPGGLMLRIAYLRNAQTSLARATWITSLSSGLWFATAAGATGFAFWRLGHPAAGAVALAASAVILAVCTALLLRHPEGGRVAAALVLLEAATFAVTATRFTWCFMALGAPVEWVQSLGLCIAYVSGAVVSVVPAGVGLYEYVGSLLAPYANLAPTLTFIAVFLDRIATLLGLAIAAGAVLLQDRRSAAA